jgi:hypothetical protein
MDVACIARYKVTALPDNPDRLQYTPDRKWPSGGKRQYRVDFVSDHATVVFDEDGKPSDLFLQMNAEARAKLQSRRQTPRSHALASDE